MDQSALGDLIGMDQSAVSRVESNVRRLTIEEFGRICAALNVNEIDRAAAIDALGAES